MVKAGFNHEPRERQTNFLNIGRKVSNVRENARLFAFRQLGRLSPEMKQRYPQKRLQMDFQRIVNFSAPLTIPVVGFIGTLVMGIMGYDFNEHLFSIVYDLWRWIVLVPAFMSGVLVLSLQLIVKKYPSVATVTYYLAVALSFLLGFGSIPAAMSV